jgi:hypothetical protein
MNRSGAGSPEEPDSSLGWRFALRRVGLAEINGLLQESIAPFRAAPLRLLGMFLLLWVAVEMLIGSIPSYGLFLKDIVGAVAYTGYTVALDAATRSDPPDFRHLGVVLRFGRDKLILLMLSGILPSLIGFLVLYGIWGSDATAGFLADIYRSPGHESAAMSLDLWAAENVASLPFAFVAPVWALYRWSGSRSMAANLLACWVNWRWVLVTTAVAALADKLFGWLLHQGSGLELLALIGIIALQMFSLAWALALARRSFPSR